MAEFKLPKTKETVVFRTSIKRKDMQAYRKLINEAVAAMPSGEIDKSSFLRNIEEQKNALVLLYVEKLGEKDFNKAVLDEMDSDDFEFLLKECQRRFEKKEEKKS